MSTQVKIVKSRRYSIIEMRALFFDYKQRMRGKSSGPREVRQHIKHQASIGKVNEWNAKNTPGALWIPENEELLIRMLKSDLAARRLFIGPNIATEKPKLAEMILQRSNRRILVPSESMKAILLDRNLGYLPENILVWFAGIDHNHWKPSGKLERQLILVYQKGPDSEHRVKLVVKTLQRLKLPSVTIKYGDYRQSEYLRLLNKCQFVIWVGHTETQGIAQFQAWSMNVPTLVSGLPVKRLEERDGSLAAAAPYLSQHTGILSEGEQPSLQEIQLMKQSLGDFSPRDWVLENATRELAISKLVKTFNDDLTD